MGERRQFRDWLAGGIQKAAVANFERCGNAFRGGGSGAFGARGLRHDVGQHGHGLVLLRMRQPVERSAGAIKRASGTEISFGCSTVYRCRVSV